MSPGLAPSDIAATIGMANELTSDPSHETASPAQTLRKSALRHSDGSFRAVVDLPHAHHISPIGSANMIDRRHSIPRRKPSSIDM